MTTTEHQLVDPSEHMARMIARCEMPGCISFNGAPHELQGDHFDLSVELVSDGPLDAPDQIPAGGCFSSEGPFFDEPYTHMLQVPRWVPPPPKPMPAREALYASTDPDEIRLWMRKNLVAMRTTLHQLKDCVLDNDHPEALTDCRNLLSQTRGLVQLIEAAQARNLDLTIQP